MLGIHRNTRSSCKESFYLVFKSSVEICSFEHYTFIGRFSKQYSVGCPLSERLIDSCIYLASNLIVLLSLGYFDTDWNERYWGC